MIRQMLNMGMFFRGVDGLMVELIQAQQEGKDITGLKEEIDAIMQMEDGVEKMAAADAFYDKVAAMPVREDFAYSEPSDLEGIKKERPKAQKLTGKAPEGDELYDKVYGAWLGRCAGCLLGKPVERWTREKIDGLAKDTGNYPISNYFSSDVSDEIKQKYGMMDTWGPIKIYGSNLTGWINTVEFMPTDDDTNYTIMGLKVLEQAGKGFTSDDIASEWINSLPALHLMTAERVGYRNIISGILPPESGWRRNPYREWIGAQIRADFYGYVAPGNPEEAAEYAWRDAVLAQYKNGIYGEMFVAAMLAAAAITDDMDAIIQAGLGEIPEKSRLAEGVRTVLGWKKDGLSWNEAIDKMHEIYNEENMHDWCLTTSNAMIVALALTFGENDFEKTIAISVHAAFDTDCNGATVGSIVGMMLGAKALPEKWIAPLNDTVLSSVAEFERSKISDLARRTVDVINK